MKTSIRMIAIFIVLVFIASDLASGQTSRVNEPVLQTQQAGTGGRTSRNTIPPPAVATSGSPVSDRLQQAFQDRAEQKYQESRAEVERDIQERQFLESMANFTRSAGRGTGINTGSENILVIPTEEVGIEELLTINEDMNVMSRIFTNELGRQRTSASNPQWSFTDSQWVPSYESILGRRTNNSSCMYLQGYGALFMMEVDFPLSGPPETQDEQEETEKEDVDKVWEQTRQQIYQPQVRATTSSRRRAERSEVKYDAQQVENLKTTLIQSLKHAANIRALAPDESVIIRVDGSGIANGILSIRALPGTDNVLVIQNYQGERISKVYEGGLPDDIEFSSPTVLIIRTERSDIDAFAKAELDIDQFREKVQVLSYPLVGGSAGGTPVPRSRSTGYTPPWEATAN